MVTYRLASPPRQAGPPTCNGTEEADIHPGTRMHSSRNRFKGGLAATSNLSGRGRVAQTCTFRKGGKKTGASKNSPLHTHTHTLSPSVPGESQLCLTKCREGEDGGGCAAIQPYGRKHLLHRPRRGVGGGGGGARNKASRVHRELGAGWVSVWGRVNVSYQRVSERVGSRCPPHGEVEGH